MEPLGEGRPLLTLQDLEARLVFTKCKPFVLAVPGRQWIFGKVSVIFCFSILSICRRNFHDLCCCCE